ncbi:DNA polymerase III subunit chi [Acidiphilium sp.]|uniref:DNA polymerase III subunit chi n=1 Tax=Acidiphilium sp. TaxID=527 RepID=UPI003D036011
MAEIGFYHLTRTDVAAALPALLGRTLAAGQRAVVRGQDPALITALDASLWLSTHPDWLPHGSADDGFAAQQPIWLTTGDDVPNQAAYLFLIDGATADLSRFTRVFDLFDGTDSAALAAARGRWVAAKTAGHNLTYWQQADRGWIKKL